MYGFTDALARSWRTVLDTESAVVPDSPLLDTLARFAPQGVPFVCDNEALNRRLEQKRHQQQQRRQRAAKPRVVAAKCNDARPPPKLQTHLCPVPGCTRGKSKGFGDRKSLMYHLQQKKDSAHAQWRVQPGTGHSVSASNKNNTLFTCARCDCDLAAHGNSNNEDAGVYYLMSETVPLCYSCFSRGSHELNRREEEDDDSSDFW